MATNTVERPLRDLDGTALQRDVEEFARAIHFDGNRLEELQRGAAVAKYENIAEAIANAQIPNGTSGIYLNEEEMTAIRNEKGALFKQSRDMYITVIVCAVAALVQGWDQTGSNGANLYWPEQLLAGDGKRIRDWKVGSVNAAPYLAASVIGCVLVDPLNKYFGRRGTIFFAAIWCFASVIGAAGAQTWGELLVCRIFLGIGMGAKASTVPIFAAESAPAYWRGSIVMCWQLWVAFGIFLGFCANLSFINVNENNLIWRFQLGSALIPAIPLLILVYVAPESPRWYMKRGTADGYRKAFNALKRLRNTELQAYRDLYFTFKQLQIEHRDSFRDSPPEEQLAVMRSQAAISFARFTQLFTVPRIRRATLGASVVMLSQQLCGINVLAFYSSTIFAGLDPVKDDNGTRENGCRLDSVSCLQALEKAAFRNKKETETIFNKKFQALLYSWGFGLVNTVFALPAVKTIDSSGRRPILLFSVANMAWTMLGAALSFLLQSGGVQKGVAGLFLYLFAAFYSPGQGPVPFTYSAEAFPLSHREAGMGLSVAVNLFFAGILTVTFPSINTSLGATGSLGLFAGLNVIAFILIFLFVPETRQKTLEELTDVFSKRTRDHMRYQTFEAFPHYGSRILSCGRRSGRPLRDFYEQDSEAVGGTISETSQVSLHGGLGMPREIDVAGTERVGRNEVDTTALYVKTEARRSEDSEHA